MQFFCAAKCISFHLWILFHRFSRSILQLSTSSFVRFNSFHYFFSIADVDPVSHTKLFYIICVFKVSVWLEITIRLFCCNVFHNCVFLLTFALDLQNELQALNENMKFQDDNKMKFSTDRIIEIKRKLWKYIQFQCNAKQLSE